MSSIFFRICPKVAKVQVGALGSRIVFGEHAPSFVKVRDMLGTMPERKLSKAAQKQATQRTAEAVSDRINELGLSRAALVRASGVSDLTIRRLEAGEDRTYRADVLARLSRALGWKPNAIAQMLNGAKAPEEVDANEPDMLARIQRLEAIVDGILAQGRQGSS